MATTWIDGTTPVNATNLNALENAVSDLSDTLESEIGKIRQTGELSAGTYQITYGTSQSRQIAIMGFRANGGEYYGTIFLNGYGLATNRNKVEVLQAGSSFTCTVLDDSEWGVKIVLGGSITWNYGILCLFGKMPTITAVS